MSEKDIIKHNVPLSDKNWFRTGGVATFYCQPTNNSEWEYALNFSKVNNLPIFVLGKGANILVSDQGFEGLVIHPNTQLIKSLPCDEHYDYVYASAGVDFNELIIWCLENNLSGLEEFTAIPGTVGGSVFINIHYFEFLLSQFIVSAEVIDIDTGKIETVSNDWFNFGYNFSTLHNEKHYLLSATFKLKKTDPIITAYNKGRRQEIMRHRFARYPKALTCGSFFRNFHENEVTLTSAGKKLIYVAYYLDKIGVKGELSVGDAIVSYQHANMIVNKGNATSQNIIDLARKMQELVYNKFNIIPKTECRLIGFNKYPLL